MNNDTITGYSGIDFTKSKLNFKQALDKYVNKRFESDEFLIYPERTTAGYAEGITTRPCIYHLLDFKADKGMRGVHLIVETFPFIRELSSKAVRIGVSNHFGISFADGFCTHTPQEIARAIRSIEKKVVTASKFEVPLFSGRNGYEFFYWGLIFQLDLVLRK